MQDSKTKGLYFEKQALQWLKQAGLKAVEQNYNCRYGEIDLVMLHDKTLCFIEVKYRRSNAFGGTAYSIPYSKQQKITRSALNFISQKKAYQQHALRFDALFISPVNDKQNSFEWIQNAFCID